MERADKETLNYDLYTELLLESLKEGDTPYDQETQDKVKAIVEKNRPKPDS